EHNTAELRGPSSKEDKPDSAMDVRRKVKDLLPNQIHPTNMVPNKEHKKVLQLVNERACNRHSDQTISASTPTRVTQFQDVVIQELTKDYYSELVQLHDKSFPNTYYNGQQIIKRLNEERKVFIIVNDGQLCGYIYVEAEPTYGEASIEFFAVEE